jgi:GH35 family endo-1,4-beta-xylanase
MFMKHTFPFHHFHIPLILFILLFSTSGSYAQLAKCKGKYFGNIIQGSVRSNYNTYWNQATSENGSKWGSIEGTRGVYNWSTSDVAYNWAKNNNGSFKFHTFVWGSQTPGWVSSASTATLTAAIHDFIKACSTHYTPMGGLNMIDVLNEPVNTPMPGNMKAALTAGYQAEPANAADRNNQYGWAIWGFQLARKYFPNATLLINEYNVEMNWNNCRAPYIAMANAVKNAPNLTDGRKNLIDGVGLQCHGIDNLTAANFRACIDEIWTKTGLPVHITEFDQVANPNEAKQQAVYSSLIPVAWEHPRVAGITLWGYVQGTTWINGNGVTGAGGTDSGIIYASGVERPAMTWLKQYLAGQPSLACCPAPGPFASCSTSTNLAPTVSISAPTIGSTFTAPASITISANAADADGTVSTVQFYNGSTLLGSDATAPYSFAWTSVTAGTYSITARAADNSGAVTTSAAISIVVNPSVNVAPTVSLTAPANNSTFTAPASITISASASDADGSIASVQFFNGTSLLGSDATAPYSFTWSSVVAGTYSITARATDNSGAVTTSAAVSISVSAAPIGDIVGPDCGSNNTTISFTLSAANRVNATNYNWWYTGSAASTAIVTGAPYSMNMQTGANFSAGQVCVDVNLSAAPWYKQFCKSISKCSSARSLDDMDVQEPVQEKISAITILSTMGNVVYSGTDENILNENNFAAGIYNVFIQYESGRMESQKIVSVK